MRTAMPNPVAKTVPVAGRYAGVLCDLWADGTILPVLRGGEGSNDPPKPPAPPAPTPEPPKPPEGKTFTQDEVTRMMAAEKDQGQRAGATAALEALATEWGVTIDRAKEIVAEHKAAEEGRLTAAQKAEADATKKLSDADKREQAAVARERAVTVKEALIDADVKPDRRDAVTRLVLPDLAADADEAAIKAAVDKAKTDYPEFFAEVVDPKANGNGKTKPPVAKPAPSSTTSSGPPAAPTGGEDKFTAGFERGKQATSTGRRPPAALNVGKG